MLPMALDLSQIHILLCFAGLPSFFREWESTAVDCDGPVIEL